MATQNSINNQGIATSSEVTTGTSTDKILTPSSLSNSDYGKMVLSFTVINPGDTITTGDDKFRIRQDSAYNNWYIVAVAAQKYVTGASTTTTIQIDNGYGANLFSTALTIDANEIDSSTAATPAVIDSAGGQNIWSTAGYLGIDIDGAGEGTGLFMQITLSKINI